MPNTKSTFPPKNETQYQGKAAQANAFSPSHNSRAEGESSADRTAKAKETEYAAPSPSRNDLRDGRQTLQRNEETFFEFDDENAKEVLLAGDFTQWEKSPVKMTKGANGTWKTSVRLPRGKHHYRYLVDGHWQDDPNVSLKTPNPFGSCDCVREIR